MACSTGQRVSPARSVQQANGLRRATRWSRRALLAQLGALVSADPPRPLATVRVQLANTAAAAHQVALSAQLACTKRWERSRSARNVRKPTFKAGSQQHPARHVHSITRVTWQRHSAITRKGPSTARLVSSTRCLLNRRGYLWTRTNRKSFASLARPASGATRPPSSVAAPVLQVVLEAAARIPHAAMVPVQLGDMVMVVRVP